MGHGPQVENHWLKGCALCNNWTLKTGNELKKRFSKLDFQKLTKILINQCYFQSTKMLAQLADLRLCALMSLCPYVPAPLCPCGFMSLRSYVCTLMSCTLLSAPLGRVSELFGATLFMEFLHFPVTMFGRLHQVAHKQHYGLLYPYWGVMIMVKVCVSIGRGVTLLSLDQEI